MPRRASPFGNDVRKRAKELKAKGMTYADIRETLRAEGLPVPSVGWLHKHGRLGFPPEHAAPAPPPAPPPPAEVAPLPAPAIEPADDDAIVTYLRGAIAESATLAKRSREVGDAVSAAKWQSSMIALTSELRKLTQRDAADADDILHGPDLRVAANRARERMRKAIDVATMRRESWQRCKACGQPIKPNDDYEDPSPLWSIIEDNLV